MTSARGELSRALEFRLRRVALLETLSESSTLVTLLVAIAEVANTYTQLGEHEQAFEWHLRAVKVAEGLPAAMPSMADLVNTSVATILTQAGQAASRAGRESERQEFLRRALERWREADDQYMVDLLEAQVAVQAPSDPLYPPFLLRSLSLVTGRAVEPRNVRYSDPSESHGRWVGTRGVHDVLLRDEYRMALALVTNDVFRVFVRAGGYQSPELWSEGVDPRAFVRSTGAPGPHSWDDKDFSKDVAKHPVTGISFEEALAFVRWLNVGLGAMEGWQWMLPTEDMWEFAARGEQGLLYPWGNEFRTGACNCNEAGLGRTTPVTYFQATTGWYGGYDFAGNVWEFVQAADQTSHRCVLRGGSFLNTRHEVKSHLRLTGVPRDHRPPDFGFRIAMMRPAPQMK